MPRLNKSAPNRRKGVRYLGHSLNPKAKKAKRDAKTKAKSRLISRDAISGEVSRQIKSIIQSDDVRGPDGKKILKFQPTVKGYRRVSLREGSPIELMISSAIEGDDEIVSAEPVHKPERMKQTTARLLNHKSRAAFEAERDLMSEEELAQLPKPSALQEDYEMKSADEVAADFGVNRTTIERRIKRCEILGFKGAKNKMMIPTIQFSDGVVIDGIEKTLIIYQKNHAAAWRFLTSTSFYGDDEARPVDRLKTVFGKAQAAETVAEVLARAQADFDGDYL